MDPYLFAIVVFVLARYVLELAGDWLNVRHLTSNLPCEFDGVYDAERYRRSQDYLRENTRLGILEDSTLTALTLAVVLMGGFGVLDRIVRAAGWGAVPSGLAFAGILLLGLSLCRLPFSVYATFAVEERYGFNRTTVRTFIADTLKSWLLTAIIGGAVFSVVVWLFETSGSAAWAYCWAAVTLFQVVFVLLSPILIMPIFNKFVPLEEGELRSRIEELARAQAFRVTGIFKMDGSRRSTKSNAFFTGLGRLKRIALFDTLIEKNTTEELLAVLAHEMGHCRRRHIPKMIILSVAATGLTFLLLRFFVHNKGLFDAFQVANVSSYAGLLMFGFLYTPVSMLLGIATNYVSRRFEFEADAYAASVCGEGDALAAALKKMSADALTNLTPHPAKVFLAYSHPPLLERIRAMRATVARAPPGAPEHPGGGGNP